MAKKNVKKQAPKKSLAEVIVDLELEFDAVAGNVERLDAALNRGDSFAKEVGDEQYNLLCRQFGAMVEYRDTLGIRLALLRRNNAKAIEDAALAKAGK